MLFAFACNEAVDDSDQRARDRQKDQIVSKCGISYGFGKPRYANSPIRDQAPKRMIAA
jgi:hypothetical protein